MQQTTDFYQWQQVDGSHCKAHTVKTLVIRLQLLVDVFTDACYSYLLSF